MRSGIIAAACILAAGTHGVSRAAEVSEQGAAEIKSNLTHVLSHDLAKSGFVSVKPDKDVYEITFDIEKFLDKISSSDFSITGLKPLTMMAAPLENGLWNIEGNGSVDISAHSKLGRGPSTDAAYSLASVVYSGVFDPAISYLRSADVAAKDIRVSSQTGPQTIEATAAGMTYKLAAVEGTEPHRVDFHVTGNMPGLYEKVVTPNAPVMEVRADSVDFEGATAGVPVREVRDLLRFVFEHVKAKKLSEKGSDRFEQLARNALPLFSYLQESASANNLTVSTGNGQFGAKKLDYSFRTDGLTKASRIDLGLRADALSVAPGLVPDLYLPLVPAEAELRVGVPDLNFAGAADLLLRADFSKASPLTKAEIDRIGDTIIADGAFTVDVPKFSAVSAVYDVEMSGKITGSVRQKGRYSGQATILARDYDKTIAFIQNAAKTDEELNQVSFGMMMAKGFAKTDPDGRQRWDIALAEDGTVTVNGQAMKMPH